jgi:hypothetical protein
VCGRGPLAGVHVPGALNGHVYESVNAGSIYIIGSMRNPRVPEVAQALRGIGLDAYDDWHSSGPESDDFWMKYEKARGRTYKEALAGVHANNVFELDKKHLDRCDACVLVMPAGKSGHLELGYMRGCKKPGYILLDGAQPERFDIMSLFATAIFDTLDEMLGALR